MQFLQDIWNAVLAEMKKNYSETLMSLWFNELRLVHLTDDTAVIASPLTYKRDILKSKYTQIVEGYLKNAVGFEVKVIFIAASDEKSIRTELRALGYGSTDELSEERDGQTGLPEEESERSSFCGDIYSFLDKEFVPGINIGSDGYNTVSEKSDSAEQSASPSDGNPYDHPEYTFDNFIVGNSNKMAHAVCLAISEKNIKTPLYEYNPLFIYGPSGLGKTHLLYATMQRLHKNYPEAKIVYVKGDDFTNQLIEAIGLKANEQFRNKYRKADVLLIDDIQFIAGKKYTQEEFFHTFNTLYESTKRIILTSDRPPKDIKPLLDRLQSRFESGPVVDISPPEFELRTAILKSKSEALGISLPNDVLQFLAENLKSNVRQLEGAIKRLRARNLLTGDEITVDLAISCVADLITGSESVNVTVDRILEKVSKKYGVSIADIKGRKRTKDLAFTRHVAVYIIRKLTNLSLPATGRIVGRHYSTIISSLDTVENEKAKNPLFEIELNELIQEIKGQR